MDPSYMHPRHTCVSTLDCLWATSARLKMAVISFTNSSSTEGFDEFVSGCPGMGEDNRTTCTHPLG